MSLNYENVIYVFKLEKGFIYIIFKCFFFKFFYKKIGEGWGYFCFYCCIMLLNEVFVVKNKVIYS